MVVVRALRKQFGEFHAVKGVSLALRRGECFGLLGENGAGKSTTISMLTGYVLTVFVQSYLLIFFFFEIKRLFAPTSGDATIEGYSILTQMPEVHRLIGVCPQFDVLWPDLTISETLRFYTRLRGVSGKDSMT